MKVNPFLLLLASVLVVFSCKKKQDCCDQPHGDYSKGVFVVNEGPFGGTGTITWHNLETGETVQDVFGTENDGAVLGQFVQSLTFFNDKGYIVVNGTNRIVVVDGTTFEYLDTIGGLALPRFFLPGSLSNQAYVTQWGADGLSGSIAVVDLGSNSVVKTIPVGSGPEKMLRLNSDVIYVANSGGYGVDSTVAVFSTLVDAVQHKFVLPEKNPACIARPDTGSVFALCKGYYDDPASQGWLGNFGPNTVGFTADKYADDLVTAPDGNTLYFLGGGAIWKYKDNAVSKLFDQPAYGLACDPATGYLYCADGKDFNSAGEVVIRRPDGSTVGSFQTGIAPGEIIFR
mgnify:CR=1 FL=1